MLNKSARTRLFPIFPEMAWLSEEASSVPGVSLVVKKNRYALTPAVLERQEKLF